MPDRYAAMIEEFNLPPKVRIRGNEGAGEVEYTGEYLNMICAELRESGNHYEIRVAALTLMEALERGLVLTNALTMRIADDEPEPVYV